MLTEYRSISLSYISTNLEILAHLDAIATVYQRDHDKFHVVISNIDFANAFDNTETKVLRSKNNRSNKNLLWLEISPYRVIMTQQNRNSVNYRHFWERGIYGKSRYWINNDADDNNQQNCLHLRNFTRSLTLTDKSLPKSLRIEYELWSNHLNLGNYVLHLEIN
ncbi:hypothetical protein GM3708_247 [Geminocystis sp. NIES-3708]|uniref:hypothetical protein n=1 Tax=Geminocystis sp. NIES-3708 TaxID=1615909 RepID=UPI0005FC6F43|nr:hypothetical protein [Geminocystis sp. NIES-3708]BAQ59841.1 hypothetical protein GM3708_247 [Geminocystis sp. NIES-3708]